MKEDIRAPQTRVFSENLNRPYEAYFPMSELQSDLSFIIQITAYITAMQSEVVDLGLTVRGHVICYLIKRLVQKFPPPLFPHPLFAVRSQTIKTFPLLQLQATQSPHFITNELYPSPSFFSPPSQTCNDIRRLCLV